MELSKVYIAVDFDGTCVYPDFPKVGKSIGAEKVLETLSNAGCNIILYTLRQGNELDEAIKWFVVNGIKVFAVNENPAFAAFSKSRKVNAQLYIDDAALGCPLITGGDRPYVDWVKVCELLHSEYHLIDGITKNTLIEYVLTKRKSIIWY